MSLPRGMRCCANCGHLASAHKSGRGKCQQPVEVGKPANLTCPCSKFVPKEPKR